MVPLSFMISVREGVGITPHSTILLILDLTEAPAGRTTFLIPLLQESPLFFPGYLIPIPVSGPAASPPGYLPPLLYLSSLRSPGGHKYSIPI